MTDFLLFYKKANNISLKIKKIKFKKNKYHDFDENYFFILFFV